MEKNYRCDNKLFFFIFMQNIKSYNKEESPNSYVKIATVYSDFFLSQREIPHIFAILSQKNDNYQGASGGYVSNCYTAVSRKDERKR